VSAPTSQRLDSAKVQALLDRVGQEVDEGLSPATQIAIGLDGEIVVDETFGAPPESRFVVYSATKAFVAGAFWQFIERGQVDVEARVVDYLPEFGSNGKDVVTIRQVLTHTSGFPMAPIGPPRWSTRESRSELYAKWRLNTPAGEQFIYHPTSAHWVLADIMATLDGRDHTDIVEQDITAPLGLPRILGIAPTDRANIITTVGVGAPPSPDEIEEVYGIRIDLAALMPPEIALAALLTLNDPDAQELGVPGGGGVMRAADLARYYQALLHNPAGLWSAETLRRFTGEVVMNKPDLMLGTPANRTLGLVVAGDDGKSNLRGMGNTVGPRAFGHNGAGGQIAFADPDSGLSVAYVTAALDQHLIRESRRTTAIASLAADLLSD
jgi:CubicO group peptidase (beta-lactamase class C family)